MERICKTCQFWQPNGGVLGIGYCFVDKNATYRKPEQTCKKWKDGTGSPEYDEKIAFWEKGKAK